MFSRKQRRKNEGTTSASNPSPPPSDLPNGGLINTTETSNQSSSIPSIPSTQIHSLNSSTNNQLIYLQPEYAVFTRSLAECNIHDLIRQPTGVDKNEWIANNSMLIKLKTIFKYFSRIVVAFFNHVNALYNAMCGFCTPTSCPVMTGPQNRYFY